MSHLAFVSVAPITPVATPVAAAARPRFAKQWTSNGRVEGWTKTGSICAVVSAAVGAIVRRSSTRQRESRSKLRAGFNPTQEVGALEPMGYWDPLHLMREGFKNPQGEWKSEETFRQYRAAELKHGRISMMAMLGLWFGTFNKWPGFADVPSGFEALDTSLGGAGLGCFFLVGGMLEFGAWKQTPDKEVGDFGWDPLGLLNMGNGEGSGMLFSYDKDLRNKELNNGRLAMSAFIVSMLFEYGGQGQASQFTFTAQPGWFFPAFLVVLTFVNGSAFYVADDSADEKPLYLQASYSQKLLGE